MQEMNNNELMNIAGGAITASLVSAVARAFSYIYSFGQSAGSTVRRILSGSYCGV